MNNVKRIFIKILPIVFVLMLILSNTVFGFGSFDANKLQNLGNGSSIESADKAVNKIWGTVTLILQVLAVAAIVFAGVRYMFASADGKADIKKQTVGLVVGAILVFGASMVVNFIVNVTSDITDTTKPASTAKYTGTTYKPKESRYSDYDKDGYNDWEDVIGKNGIPDIYEQDTNNNGIVDFEDLWIVEHPEDK